MVVISLRKRQTSFSLYIPVSKTSTRIYWQREVFEQQSSKGDLTGEPVNTPLQHCWFNPRPNPQIKLILLLIWLVASYSSLFSPYSTSEWHVVENWERHLSETDSCTNCFWCCSQFSLKSHSIVMWRNCVITTLLCYKISPTLLLKSLIYGRNGWTMMLTNLIRTQVWFAMLHWRAFYCIGNVFVMICYRWYWNFIFWSRFWTLFDFVSKVTLSLYHYSWWDGA